MPSRRKNIRRRPFDVNQNTIAYLQPCWKNRNWRRRRTQRDLLCFYHYQFEQSPDYNYHVSVWDRKRDSDDRVDHHATLFIKEDDGSIKKIHYGYCRSREKVIWVDEVDRNDPKQLKIIELYDLFEADMKTLLSEEEINRLNI